MTESERAWIEEEWWDDPFSGAFACAGIPVLIYEIPFYRTLNDELFTIH